MLKLAVAFRSVLALAAIVSAVAAGSACAQTPAKARPPVSIDPPLVQRPPIARGVNFGNMLEAPNEGEWGLSVQSDFFDRAREAGFDHIRLPITWTTHAATTPPYTIDPAFMDRVEWCVDQALARSLKIIVNVHHYDQINANPALETPRALAIWDQIATRLAGKPDAVLFEVLNEPQGGFNAQPALWDGYLLQAMTTIRRTNPTRWVLAGPTSWNAIRALDSFHPPRDHRLCITVHYYDPFGFTHQGASWVSPVLPVGQTWNPAYFGMAWPWQGASWQTTLRPAQGGMVVEYLAGWAGASFRRPTPITAARAIEFTVDRAMNLKAIAELAGVFRETWIATGPGVNTYRFNLPSDFTTVDRVTIQNGTSSPGAPFVLSNLRVITQTGEHALLRSQAEDVDAALARAARWAAERGFPIHLGEFGAYSAGDMPSRQAWTRAVRTAAERNGMAWSYWEFGAGFGVYDPQAGAWRGPLLHALTAD